MKYFYILALLAVSTFRLGAQTSVRTFANIADAIASTTLSSASTNIDVLGYWLANDGGGGKFIYDKDSAAATNRGIVFKPTSLNGRLLRQFTPNEVDVRWFGAKGTLQIQGAAVGPDDTEAIKAALAYANTTANVQIKMGVGDFMISDTLRIPQFTSLVGVGELYAGSVIGGGSGTNTSWWNRSSARTRLYAAPLMNVPMISISSTNYESRTVSFYHPRGLDGETNLVGNGTWYTNYYWAASIQNMILDGGQGRTRKGCYGIFIDRCNSVTLRNVTVFGAPGYQLWTEGNYAVNIENCQFFPSATESLGTMFKRNTDSTVFNSQFVGNLHLEDCGANLYANNFYYNNLAPNENKSCWSNILATATSDVFTYPGHNIQTGYALQFMHDAPGGFNTNNTYYAYRIDGNTFKLNSKIGNTDQGGAREGFGITSTSTGGYYVTAVFDTIVYMHHSRYSVFTGGRSDQSRSHHFLVTGTYGFGNQFDGVEIINMGFDYNGGLHTTDTIPWYAGYWFRDSAYLNSVNGGQINAADRYPANSIGVYISNGSDYNHIAPSFYRVATNYVVEATGTAHNSFDYVFDKDGNMFNPPDLPVVQPEERAINYIRSENPRITSDIRSWVIGTNDFTVAIQCIPQNDLTQNGIFGISSSPSIETSAYSMFCIWKNFTGSDMEVTMRSSAGSASVGDFKAQYYPSQAAKLGEKIWIVVTRAGSTVTLYVDGQAQTPSSTAGSGDYATAVANGTNYLHIGFQSNSSPFNGPIYDAMVFNKALSASDVLDMKFLPIPYKYKDGSVATITSGTLEVGKEYRILTYVAPDDFANVGGTNITGNVFTATGTTPTAWGAGSTLLHNGVVLWPDFRKGYGTDLPDHTVNDFVTTGHNIRHMVTQPTLPSPDSRLNIPMLEGVGYNRALNPRITADLRAFVIGTNDFTVAQLMKFPSDAVANGVFALSGSATSDAGPYSFYCLLKNNDNGKFETTIRSSAGGSASGDYAAHYYPSQSSYVGKTVWVVVTRKGEVANTYIDGLNIAAETSSASLAGFASSIGTGTNYWHIGLQSSASSWNDKIHAAMLFNFAMSATEVQDLNFNSIPLKWYDGAPYTTLTSGTLEAGHAYKIITYNAPDDFTNAGASANAANVVFVANDQVPAAWAASSALLKLGVICWPDLTPGVGYQFKDFTANKYRAVAFNATGIKHLQPKKNGSIRFRTSTNGNQQILGATLSIPTNARISDWTIYSDATGTATTSVDLGNASGGAEIASGVVIAGSAGYQDVGTFVSRYSTTGNLWVKANGDSKLDHVITYVVIE